MKLKDYEDTHFNIARHAGDACHRECGSRRHHHLDQPNSWKNMNMKELLKTVAAAWGLLVILPAHGQNWTPTSAPSNNWTAVASSADGVRLAALNGSGGIYTSADSGATWTSNNAPAVPWTSVASSSSGNKLVAAASVIYTNSGTTWAAAFSVFQKGLTCVASSADGSKLVAGASLVFPPLYIYVSANSGASWTPAFNASSPWRAVASSSDGSNLVAAAATTIYSSTNAGANWTLEAGAPNLPWNSVASSADGSRIVAAGTGGIIISTNSGSTWQAKAVPAVNWTSVASSADGSRLAAVSNDGLIMTSADSGANWTTNDAPPGPWTSVASSSDGSKLVAVMDGGGIYVLQPASAPVLNIVHSGSAVVLSWGNPTFSLQAAPAVNGVYTNVTGATSPYTNTIGNPQKFFRLQGN